MAGHTKGVRPFIFIKTVELTFPNADTQDDKRRHIISDFVVYGMGYKPSALRKQIRNPEINLSLMIQLP
jgi:hypothetical protein